MNYQQQKRYNKIFTENLYLLDKKYDKDNMIFQMSGSTANIYKIIIYSNTKNIICNCPDMKSWAKSYNCICKHCCFIIFRVLQCFTTQQTNFFNILYFTDIEINCMKDKFNKLTMTNNENYVDNILIKKFQNIDIKNNNNKFIQNREINDEEYCIICFEDFIENNKKNNVECPICHNIIHNQCMKKWIKMGKINCVYCRSDVWKNFTKKIHNEYINLFD